MSKAVNVIGALVIAAAAIAWSRSGPQLTRKTEVTVVSPYETVLQLIMAAEREISRPRLPITY